MSDNDIEPVLANYQIADEPEESVEGSDEEYLNAETIAMGGGGIMAASSSVPAMGSAMGSVLGGGDGCWVGSLINAAAVATIVVLVGLIIVMVWRWASGMGGSGGGGSGLSSGPPMGAQNSRGPPPPYSVAVRRPSWESRWGADNRDGRNNFDREMDHYPDVQWSGRMPRPHFIP